VERRKHPRIACRIPCEFEGGLKGIKGVVRDLSTGGLSVRADIRAPSEGELLSLTLRPPGSGAISLDCLAWHVRRLRHPGTGRSVTQLGLVLARGSEPFMKLVTRLATGPGPTARSSQRPTERETPLPTRALRQFAVRVKQDGGPRTRRIVVGAVDSDDAANKARAEIQSGWVVLDEKPA